MRIVDSHEDIAWNALNFGRDVLRSAWETRRLEEGAEAARHGGRCMLGLAEWLEGGVAVVFGSIFTAPARRALGSWDRVTYANAAEAYRQGSAQLDYYHGLADVSDRVDLVGSQADLNGVLASWDEDAPRVGIVPSLEGADPIRVPAEVEEFYERGVRVVSLSWGAGSRYAGGDRMPGPLTGDGWELLQALAEVGMILDVSHLAEEAFWQAVDRYEGQLVATHSNPRALVPGPRQLSDQMIRALAERGGVIGTALWNGLLKPDWRSSGGKEGVTVEDVVAAVDHVCQVVGSAANVGLGSDMDGGFGAEAAPDGFETVADLPKIAKVLRERGYAETSIDSIMAGNWLRVLRSCLPAS